MAKKQKQQKQSRQKPQQRKKQESNKKQEVTKKQESVQQVVQQPYSDIAEGQTFMRKYGLWVVGLALIVVFLVMSFARSHDGKAPSDVPQANVEDLPPLKVQTESSADGGLQPNAPKQSESQSSVQSGAPTTQGTPSALQGSSLTEREFRERGY